MSLKDIDLSPTKKGDLLKSMAQDELIEMRNQIDERLGLELKDIDLKAEVVLQLRQAKTLYAEVSKVGSNTPANQMAQVLGTLSAIIAAITKTAEAVYSIERHKKIEAATLAAIRQAPVEVQERFFEVFKSYLEDENG